MPCGTTDGDLQFITIRVSLAVDCNSGCVRRKDVRPEDVNYPQGILFLSRQSSLDAGEICNVWKHGHLQDWSLSSYYSLNMNS